MTRSRLVLSLAAFVGLAVAARADGDPVRIGLVESIFNDVPSAAVDIVAKRFSSVMKDLTALEGKAFSAGDAFAVGAALDKKELELGVFQGYEFAWAQQRYPNLRPLMIAVNQDRQLRSCLIVPKSSPAKNWSDLKGKHFALPLGSKGHCSLYLQRRCQCTGECAPKSFFARITRPSYPEAALDEVCSLDSHATVVDRISWGIYQRVKPGNAAHLKVIQESEIFPAGVIAYRAGALTQQTLDAVKNGLLNAPNNARARQLMMLIQITSFETIPDDYAGTLANILKTYPPAPSDRR
jgi:ABC-type phosphate/phosphonate transport system substrate-binding protein